MNKPTTIEGTPVSTSAMKRMIEPIRGLAYSETKMPISRPTGIATTLASETMITVPTIEFLTPPPVSPSGFGVFVKKSRLRWPTPLRNT